MALRLLVVDPDDKWLERAQDILVKSLYEVDCVGNGKDAQLAMYNHKYFAVIMNIATKDHSALQVLKFIKTNSPNQRTIIVANDDKALDKVGTSKEDLIKNGILEIMTKPFDLSKLGNVLEGHQSLADAMSNITKRDGQSDEVEVQGDDNDYSAIKISSFYSAQSVLFDIYVKLSSGRYIKILHAGDTFSKERIDKYKNDKGVEFLYFHVRDRRKYIQYVAYLSKKVNANKKMPTQAKVNLLKSVSEKYAEEVFTQGLKPQIIDQGKDVVANLYNVIENQDDLYELLKSYKDFDPNSFSHAYLVTLFASSIIKQFEWQSRATIENTAMACMFHDIGKMSLPKELLEKRPKDMNEDEIAKYKEHPKLGIELIGSNRMINNSIKQIVLQHHEYFNGTGFPFGIKGVKILMLANIVCLANDFSHIMIDNDFTPIEALKNILMNQEIVARYNSTILENFINVFVDPAKVARDKKMRAIR